MHMKWGEPIEPLQFSSTFIFLQFLHSPDAILCKGHMNIQGKRQLCLSKIEYHCGTKPKAAASAQEVSSINRSNLTVSICPEVILCIFYYYQING